MSAPTPETPPVETPPVVVPPAPETPPPPPEGGGQQPDPEVFDKTYVEKLRRENAGYRTKAQENAEAARKLKEIEDRDLSELQKAQRDREEALTRLQAIEREALRNRVALAKGLPAEIAATLTGSSEEELAAHADALIAWRGNVPPTTPRPDPGQGPRPATPDQESDQEYFRYFPDEARRG
jgi:hypothetical protein